MKKLMNEQYDIYELIAKSFTSGLTEQEGLHLNQWIGETKSNHIEYQDLQEIWQISGRMAMPTTINLSKSLENTRRIAGINRRIDGRVLFYQVAAVITLAVILSALYTIILPPKNIVKKETVVYQEIKSAYGTQSKVVLSDGTVVNLNSGSSLRFPANFTNMNERNVKLTGEGYFEVAKNAKQPFIVDVDKLQIKVTGTKFNVNAYSGNSAITVALVEGEVSLQQKISNHTDDLITMKPSQVAVYYQSKNKLICEKEEDLNRYTSWKEGRIVFSNDPVNIVVQRLENWYNVDIVLADKRLEKFRFTGTFIDESLEQVLNIINLTSGMTYTIIPAEKLADNSYTKRKIILKLKKS